MKRIPIESLINKNFGRLTVLSEADPGPKYRRIMVCKCVCGNEVNVHLSNLLRNHTTSCGCALISWIKTNKVVHNLRGHTLYSKWANLKDRCLNPTTWSYKHYGGRGIKVCEEWLNNFQAFYNWAIENGWQEGLEIDRINNDGNYEPDNCRFVTHKANSQNRVRGIAI